MNISEEQIMTLLASFIWPFFRLGGMFVTIPIFSIKAVTFKIRVIAALLITWTVIPVLPDMPSIEIFSYNGFLVSLQQIMIGITTGFILQMVFAVMLVAGQAIAYSMGLGFASLVDPATGIQVPVVAQIFVVTSSLLFLSVDGHLLLIEMLAESFYTLPVAELGLSKADYWKVIIWSSHIFAAGVLLSLPVMVAILLVNVSFGVASRAAPQLQIFGVGFPITILLGMVLIWLMLAEILDGFLVVLSDGYGLLREILRLS